jgi:hypothetical protein
VVVARGRLGHDAAAQRVVGDLDDGRCTRPHREAAAAGEGPRVACDRGERRALRERRGQALQQRLGGPGNAPREHVVAGQAAGLAGDARGAHRTDRLAHREVQPAHLGLVDDLLRRRVDPVVERRVREHRARRGLADLVAQRLRDARDARSSAARVGRRSIRRSWWRCGCGRRSTGWARRASSIGCASATTRTAGSAASSGSTTTRWPTSGCATGGLDAQLTRSIASLLERLLVTLSVVAQGGLRSGRRRLHPARGNRATQPPRHRAAHAGAAQP